MTTWQYIYNCIYIPYICDKDGALFNNNIRHKPLQESFRPWSLHVFAVMLHVRSFKVVQQKCPPRCAIYGRTLLIQAEILLPHVPLEVSGA